MDIMNSNQKKPNANISCDVANCSYHNSENYCVAKKINVGPSYAESTSDTICTTFSQK